MPNPNDSFDAVLTPPDVTYVVYVDVCARAGIEVTDGGYWRWREVIARCRTTPDAGVQVRKVTSSITGLAGGFASLTSVANITADALNQIGRAMAASPQLQSTLSKLTKAARRELQR